jgi:hypothetical protein
MSLKQLSHSPDIARLMQEGLQLQMRDGLLVVHHVPYVNNKKEVLFGTLVSELNIANPETTIKPAHTIHFCGNQPCDINGNIIQALVHSSPNFEILTGLTADHMFSNKPPDGYTDYYHKISTYVKILSSPAMALNSQVTRYTFFQQEQDEGGSVFQYCDTNSGRAKLTGLNKKYSNQKIAIIGMGGTGSYILDYVAKTPVSEIHLFDGKLFYQHNAFRSPGAPSLEQLHRMYNKADYYCEVYSQMHKGIVSHPYYITPENIHELKTFSFAFVAIDKPEVKKYLLAYLLKMNIPFMDVGMGLHLGNENLTGTIRVTAGSANKSEHLASRISMEEDQDNDYNENIQIAELNSLNATLAVIKWKKFLGYYQDLENEYTLFYSINTSQLINEDH